METVYQPRRVHAATVMPMYNKSGNVAALVEAMLQTISTLDTTPNSSLSTDGSRDSIWRAICAVTAEHNTVRGIKLARSFGHQPALVMQG